jgi:signal transduction histidine kinase
LGGNTEMDSNQEIKNYMQGFEDMSELFQKITGEETEKDFMNKLLDVAIKSIPEAESGSIWKIEGTLYKAVAGYLYDEELLNNMEIPFEESYIKNHMDEEVHEVHNISNYNKRKNVFELSSKLHSEHKEIVTIISPLRIKNKIVGHLYIDNFKLEKFSDNSKKMLKVFSNLASTFLSLRNLRDKEKEANELNSVYLSFITHELRTPLTSIIGFSETVLSDDDIEPQDMRRFMRKVYASAKHLNSLIDDISTFNKLNRQTKMKIEQIKFKQILFESISIVEPMTSPDVELNINYKTEIPENIITDGTKLRQILVNIIGNSVKYTDYGYVDINISYNEGTKLFSIEVDDSGPGIPENKLKDIFKPFYRLSKDKPGSGLGLAIVKKTIKSLKGSIDMTSEMGYGTKTLIKLPLKINPPKNN